ncbi:TIGR03986 family type III CRISPR-associated RAMP protein [Flavivirga jejuensis]|uniref:TIGR03986 family CRISPR-associated RAMP protein n=1 Tax=Flavivirga jejuensis TaxID=870487 RepID=A0ABT8WVC0_9FLAO|nr:TIGR03986 family CRISPR-associated RAMP protein [Flavivirga jejuensis]MDO5976945.1 TIGR03986 family CRISPR-associated RAMP protein [Flavivirga jejuensis]
MPRNNDNRNQNNITISAPYNFVPLNKKVFFPDWAPFVSHDIPFKDGLSGKIKLEITAESPIFIRKSFEEGDEYYKDKNGQEISKEFCFIKDKTGNKKYFIPGSSIRNMLRSVFEILTFSKLSRDYFTDRRFGVRDFDNDDVYTLKKESDSVRIGYLKKTGKDYVIYDKGNPVKVLQSEIKYTKKLRGNNITNSFKELFSSDTTWNREVKDRRNNLKANCKTAEFKYKQFKKSFDSTKENYVFTGQPTFNNNNGAKYHEFKIPALNENNDVKINVDNKIFEDFKFIYGDYYGSNKTSVDWKYWKSPLDKGKAIPVFFRKNNEDELIDFGLCNLYKMAYNHRVNRAVKNAQNEFEESNLDLSECVFGTSEGKKIKGRVQVSHAFMKEATEGDEITTVLSEPKASFYPFYIKQKLNKSLKVEKYATYHDSDVEINGRKRYFLKPECVETRDPSNFTTTFKPLETATFITTIQYHNLNKIEFGALLSAITFHGNTNCNHIIGLAKSYGLGQIKVDILNEEIKQNLNHYLAIFEKCMLEAKGINWHHKSPELIELLTMASTIAKNKVDSCNPHMHKYLNLRGFLDIKKTKLRLPLFSEIISYSENVPSYFNAKKETLEVEEKLKKEREAQKILTLKEKGIRSVLEGCNDFGAFKNIIKDYMDKLGIEKQMFTKDDVDYIEKNASNLILKKNKKHRADFEKKVKAFVVENIIKTN